MWCHAQVLGIHEFCQFFGLERRRFVRVWDSAAKRRNPPRLTAAGAAGLPYRLPRRHAACRRCAGSIRAAAVEASVLLASSV
jgi:hypothetical protein